MIHETIEPSESVILCCISRMGFVVECEQNLSVCLVIYRKTVRSVYCPSAIYFLNIKRKKKPSKTTSLSYERFEVIRSYKRAKK